MMKSDDFVVRLRPVKGKLETFLRGEYAMQRSALPLTASKARMVEDELTRRVDQPPGAIIIEMSFSGDDLFLASSTAPIAGAVSTPAPVPTLTNWGMLLLLVLLTAIGFSSIRRRRDETAQRRKR